MNPSGARASTARRMALKALTWNGPTLARLPTTRATRPPTHSTDTTPARISGSREPARAGDGGLTGERMPGNGAGADELSGGDGDSERPSATRFVGSTAGWGGWGWGGWACGGGAVGGWASLARCDVDCGNAPTLIEGNTSGCFLLVDMPVL